MESKGSGSGGNLYLKRCACGNLELAGRRIDASLLSSTFHGRDIVYIDSALSRECFRRYNGEEPDPASKIKESCSSPTILIADDESGIRRILRSVLRIGGYKNFTLVGTGDEALSELVGSHYDLFITDTNMPGIRGYEVIQRYKASPTANGTRFIGMSGHLDDSIRGIYSSLGASVISKPFSVGDLVDLVDTVLKP